MLSCRMYRLPLTSSFLLEYSLIPEVLSYTLPTTKNLWWVSVPGPEVLVTFYFRFQISISGCSFCSQLMKCLNLRKLGASRFRLSTCQPGNRSEYIHAEGTHVRGPDPSGPKYADPPPPLRRWQLVLKYFRYQRVLEYSLIPEVL